MTKKSKRKVVGWTIFTTVCLSTLIFVYYGLNPTLNFILLILLPVIAAVLLFGWKETIFIVIPALVGVLIFAYIQHLQNTLSGKGTDLRGFMFGRVIVLIISFALYMLLRYVFPQSLSNFFKNIWGILCLPDVAKSLLHLFISYLAITSLFGVVYASIYIQVGQSSFKSDKPLNLLDFFYYSLFVPTTLGYPEISASHWLTRVVTLIELGFGITVIVIYLGTIVGSISNHMSAKK